MMKHSSKNLLEALEPLSLEMYVFTNQGCLHILWRKKKIWRAMWLRVLVVNLVLITKVHKLQDRMLYLLNLQERAKPSQHPLKVVNIMVINKGIGLRVESLQVPQGRKGMTKALDRSLNKISLLKVFSKTLARVVHNILVLLRVFMELVRALGEIVILVANPAIKLWDVILNHLLDLVAMKLDQSLLWEIQQGVVESLRQLITIKLSINVLQLRLQVHCIVFHLQYYLTQVLQILLFHHLLFNDVGQQQNVRSIDHRFSQSTLR